MARVRFEKKPRAWMKVEIIGEYVFMTSPKGGTIRATYNKTQTGLSRCLSNMFRVIKTFHKKKRIDALAECQLTIDQIKEFQSIGEPWQK